MQSIIATVLFFIGGCLIAEAQSIDSMRMALSERTEQGNFIQVEEDDATASSVRAVEGVAKPSKVSGYRVVIFFDNSQYAGDNAKEVLTAFREHYPLINAYLVYESPYFKVSVGDCLTMEEAVILMNSFIADYPRAFPKREDIKLSELSNVRKPVVEEEEDLSTSLPTQE